MLKQLKRDFLVYCSLQ